MSNGGACVSVQGCCVDECIKCWPSHKMVVRGLVWTPAVFAVFIFNVCISNSFTFNVCIFNFLYLIFCIFRFFLFSKVLYFQMFCIFKCFVFSNVCIFRFVFLVFISGWYVFLCSSSIILFGYILFF